MEIAVISGKGGTGKSSITAALATMQKDIVLVDCDVDAANLHLLFNPYNLDEQVYVGGQKAVINYDLCTACELCVKHCRFNAISVLDSKVIINENNCDGCKLCSRICPENAINIVDNDKSRMFSGDFRKGKMVFGRLAPGEENSGKLVNLVREKAKDISKSQNINTILIDGPPGIGCPVISTITGVDKVIVVTEPSISGFHDFKRVLEIILKFDLQASVVINKCDLNTHVASMIKDHCLVNNVKVIGEIPYDQLLVDSMVNCKSIYEYAPESETTALILEISKIVFNGKT
ncbi:MAG: ATP-binding protein [Bacteroidales bacterium]